MKIGIGLPNPVPGTTGSALLEFARRAERRGFHAPRTPEAVRDTVAAFADAGCTELYLDTTTTSSKQVDRLADVVL